MRAMVVRRNDGAITVDSADLSAFESWIAVDSDDPFDALKTSDPGASTEYEVLHRVRRGGTVVSVDLFPFDWEDFAFGADVRAKLNAPDLRIHFDLDLTLTRVPGGGASRFGVQIDRGMPTGFFEIADGHPCDCSLVVDWTRLVALSEGLLSHNELLDKRSEIGGSRIALSYFAGLMITPAFRESVQSHSAVRHLDLALALHAGEEVVHAAEDWRVCNVA